MTQAFPATADTPTAHLSGAAHSGAQQGTDGSGHRAGHAGDEHVLQGKMAEQREPQRAERAGQGGAPGTAPRSASSNRRARPARAKRNPAKAPASVAPTG